MKKTKLLTSLAAFVLVLGLGACNQPDEETTSEEGGEVTTTDTGSSSEGETPSEPVAYAIVGDFVDNSWNESPATDSIYYIPAGTEHYEATVEVPTADTLGYEPSFRVVEYGTWNLVADYDNLDVDNSTGVTGSHGNDNNIELIGGTYDLVFDFGETNTILVTLQTEEGGEGGEGEGDETIPGTNYAIGETYWLGYEYNDALYAFTGAIVSSNYGGVVTDTNGAASVTLGKVEGGYTLSVDDAGTTKYVAFSENNTYRNFALVEEAFVWEYNATYDTFVALDSTNDYVFIGNYYGASQDYDELRISSIGYLDGSKSSSYTQLPSHLFAQDTPTALTITGGRESLYVGNTVKLGIEVANRANHDVTWSSSDATSISVDAYGTIEALALADSVTITATSVKDENVTASINIAVVEATQEEVKLCSYDFSKKTDTTNSTRSTSQMETIFSQSFVAGEATSNIVTAVTTADTIYAQAGGNTANGNSNLQLSTACIKFGKGSTKGELAFTVSNTITKIELQAAGWSGSQPLTINGVQQSITQSAGSVSAVDNLNTYTYEIAEATSIDMVTSERVLLFNMTFYGYL